MIINSKIKLEKIIKTEKNVYFKNNRDYFVNWLLNSETYNIFLFQKVLRHLEYHSSQKETLLGKIIWIYWKRKKNRLGIKLGFSIPENVFDVGLRIYHVGCVVVNPNAKVGKNCILIGNNCIGSNDGINEAATIGDDCVIGFGASIIGAVKIGNEVKIGAGAVVVKSYNCDGVTVVGVPGHVV